MYICIDPGITFCSIVVVNDEEKFDVVESQLVNNSRVFDAEYKELEKIHGTRTTKILKIVHRLQEAIDKYGIDTLIVEAPFYSSRTPAAYASLLEVVLSIRYLIVMPGKMNMTLIEPTAVKKMFTGKGNATKDMMKEFLITRMADKEISIPVDIETLSEHEIDGIAVGFTHWLNKQTTKKG